MSEKIRTTAQSTGTPIASTATVKAKQPGRLDGVPLRWLEGAEGIAMGFRQNMLRMGDIGSVDTGTGLGTDFIILTWGEHKAFIRGSELLRAWVATFAPQDAARFPDDVREAPEFDAEAFKRFAADPKRREMVKRILADEEPST